MPSPLTTMRKKHSRNMPMQLPMPAVSAVIPFEDFEGALADFQKYAVAKPEDGELNFLIGSSYMNLEQEEAAESYLRKAS